MENKERKLTKKELVSLIIAIVFLFTLIAGASFAYFRVAVGNTSNKSTILGDVGGNSIGAITLSGGNANLYMALSLDDMKPSKVGTTYYSSVTEGSRETSVDTAGKATYTAILSGDESDSVMYACDYEFTITSTGSMLDKESLKDVEMVFSGDINKTINITGNDKIKGTWYGFKKSNATREFDAYLQLTNKNIKQNDIAGTDLLVEVKNTKWNCYLKEVISSSVGDEYALLVPNGGSYEGWGNDILPTYDLFFVRSEKPITKGEEFNGSEIVEVYTDFENSEYYSTSDVPWNEYTEMISSVHIEDEIKPRSTAYWFAFLGNSEIDVELEISNLNTTLVTTMTSMFEFTNLSQVNLDLSGWNVADVIDMSYMFYAASWKSLNLSWGDKTHNVETMESMFHMEESFSRGPKPIGIENWNVSNVNIMAGMFSFVDYNMDLSNWDVSSVSSMSEMFCDASSLTYVGDLSNWDVSNVNSMNGMFSSTTSLTNIGDISKWNVSNVEDMSWMFYNTGLLETLDLSYWEVSKVDYYDEFTDNEMVIPPLKFQKAYALYTESNSTLTFVRSILPYNEGDMYNGLTITKVIMGFEEDFYENEQDIPWAVLAINKIVFKDKIIPNSIAWWFSEYSGEIDLTNLDLSNATSMEGTFYRSEINYDYGLKKLDISNVTSMSHLFASATINVDLGIDSWNVSHITNMAGMFWHTTLNKNINLISWDVSNVSNYYEFSAEMSGTGTLIQPKWTHGYFSVYSETDNSLRLYNIETTKMPKAGDILNDKVVTQVLNGISNGKPINCSTVVPTSIIVEDNIIAPISTDSWFSGCRKVNYIDVSKLDTSNVTRMGSMFYDVGGSSSVTSMTIIGIDSFDTSKVFSMYEMFYNFGKNAAYTLDLSGWDVPNIKSAIGYRNFNYGVETKVIAPTWSV